MDFEKIKIKKRTEDEKILKKTRERRKMAADYAAKTSGSIDRYRGLEIPITKEFLGEKVLDLGAGFSGDIPKYAAERGIKIYSLSESFSEDNIRSLLKERVGDKINKEFPFFAGLAQELPFKSNTFDSVLSVFSIPFYLDNKKREYKDTFKEIVRVLKPGGKAYLYPLPLWIDDKTITKRMNEIRKNFLKEKVADIKLDDKKIIVSKLEKENKDRAMNSSS